MAATPIVLNPGTNATASTLPLLEKAMDIAKAKNYAGVRFSVGLSGFGNSSRVTTTSVVAAVQYAQSIGLSYVQLLLNLGPKADGTVIVSLNGGPLPVPHLPSNTGVLDYVVQAWQDFIDACRAVAPDSFLHWEGLNEGCRGGNQTPQDSNGTYTTYPLNTTGGALLDGQYPPQTAISLNYVASRVNFHSCQFCLMTLEGSGTTTAQREVDSITGAGFTTLFGLTNYTHIGTNRYADQPATPYNTATTQAAFSTKLGQQTTRMAANSLIGSTPISLREFGLDAQRGVQCVTPNDIRQDLVDQVKLEAGIADGGFFCCFDPASLTGAKQNTATSQQYWFAAYDPNTSLPVRGCDPVVA